MPSYHSKIEASRSIGNLGFLTFRTKCKGPVVTMNPSDLTVNEIVVDGSNTNGDDKLDIVDEALLYFKSNVFFKSFEVTSDADRVLIYLTLYITECLKRLQKCGSKEQANQELHALAISRFDIPGDPGFPLNSVFARPNKVDEQSLMRQYLLQLRQECGIRLCDRIWDRRTGGPSKWWTCFAKRKFMDLSLSAPGN